MGKHREAYGAARRCRKETLTRRAADAPSPASLRVACVLDPAGKERPHRTGQPPGPGRRSAAIVRPLADKPRVCSWAGRAIAPPPEISRRATEERPTRTGRLGPAPGAAAGQRSNSAAAQLLAKAEAIGRD